LILCRDFYNSIHPQGPPKKDNQLQESNFSNPQEQAAHHKKICQWFLNPSKFCTEIEGEQKKHPGKCNYHLSKSHPTHDCNVKKECEKLLAEQKKLLTSSSLTTPSGHLRNLKEEIFEDAVAVDSDAVVSDSSNNTNEDDLYYFAHLKNHYLRLVKTKSASTRDTHHNIPYPIIADSGANFHMFKELEFFESIVLACGHVILGDGKTTLPIRGIGTARCTIGNQTLRIENICFVPTLAESIYSLFLHIKQPDHGLHSSFETGLHILFPTFQTQVVVGTDDLYLQAQPHADNKPSDQCILSLGSLDDVSMDTFCWHVDQFHSDINTESKNLDNLLKSLRQYYKEVKTKCQLNLNVPAGFRQSSNLQKNFHSFTPPRQSSVLVEDNIEPITNYLLCRQTIILPSFSSYIDRGSYSCQCWFLEN
jgi:hypothetical protein